MGRRIAEAFAAEGWRGPLNIQCQRAGDGRLLVHEFNGRFTGATSDRWMLGFDEVGETIELYTGFRFARPRPRVPHPARCSSRWWRVRPIQATWTYSRAMGSGLRPLRDSNSA